MLDGLKRDIIDAIDNFDAEQVVSDAIDNMDAGELLDSIRHNMSASDILDVIGDDLDGYAVTQLVQNFGLEREILSEASSYDLQIELSDRGDYFDGIDSEQLRDELDNRGETDADLDNVPDEDLVAALRDRGFHVETKLERVERGDLVNKLLEIARLVSEAS